MLTSIAWRLRERLTPDRSCACQVDPRPGSEPGGFDQRLVSSLSSVAITFDDGPDPVVTPQVLDLLTARGVHATFFVLIDRAERNVSLVRRVVAEGHELALHSDRHERLSEVPPLALTRRLRAARQAAGGNRRLACEVLSPSVRSPVAAYLSGCPGGRARCGRVGPYAEDWKQAAPEVVAARGLNGLRHGDVLLLHDGLVVPPGEPVPTFDRVRAFELTLDGMAGVGLIPTTVSGLLAGGRPRRTAWFRP